MTTIDLLLEWTAAATGAGYLFLVAKKNKWAWLSGGISSFIYIFVFYSCLFFIHFLIALKHEK
jgi:nicotinamide riboside transporter PnuC